MTTQLLHAPLLDVDELSVRFLLGPGGRDGVVSAVSDVSLALRPGRVTALVGESGCGKSVLAATLLGLLPVNAQLRGQAVLRTDAAEPLELLGAPEDVLSGSVRGRLVGLVPQSAASHLTPVRSLRAQLREALRALRPEGQDIESVQAELLARVALGPWLLDLYPYEMSGGTAQRAALALALAGDPPVVLADEPTTGLDRPLVNRVVDLLAATAADGRAVLLITHDLAAARRVATDLAVMYASRLVEVGPAGQLLDDPWHPYTASLLGALPDGGFQPIPGHPPELTALPEGCAFCHRRPQLPGFSACTGDPRLIPYGARWVAGHPPC